MSLQKYRKLLGKTSGLESTGSNAAFSLSSADTSDILDRTRDQLKQAKRPIGVSRADFDAARKRLMNNAPQALDKISQNIPEKLLEPQHRFALEAIVHADGTRNAFYINNNTIDTDHYSDALGEWRTRTKRALPSLEEAAKSVGRIDLGTDNPRAIGTCFAISENRIATNLHVLQELAERSSGGTWGDWEPDDKAVVNFQGEQANDGEPGFEITRVLKSGPFVISKDPSPERLDLAVLEVEPINGAQFPRAMRFDKINSAARETSSASLQKDRKIYALGFPINPLQGGSVNDVLLVFGGEFGVKHWAPGEILELPGHHPKDDKVWMFTHDASTLGGNSGSLIMDFKDTDNPLALGLHFGGWVGKENRAHAVAELEEFLAPFGADFRLPA